MPRRLWDTWRLRALSPCSATSLSVSLLSSWQVRSRVRLIQSCISRSQRKTTIITRHCFNIEEHVEKPGYVVREMRFIPAFSSYT